MGCTEIQGNRGELGGGAALEEENGVGIGDIEERSEIRFSFLDDGEEGFATVAHFVDGHASIVPVDELGLGFEEDFFREGSWAGGEVEESAGGGGGGGGGGGLESGGSGGNGHSFGTGEGGGLGSGEGFGGGG